MCRDEYSKTNYHLLALCALIFLSLAQSVETQEIQMYDLWAAGEQITSANCENFTDDALIEGKLSYDPTKKELTLDNVSD